MNKECIKKLEEAIEALSKYIEQQDNRIKVPKQPEPQKERKIVFDWFINQEGKVVVPYSNPNEFDRIEERFKLGDKFYLFSAHYSQGAPVKIYIGHYE
jgi:hypothetical protein